MIYIQTLDKAWSPGEKMLKSQNQQVRKQFETYIAHEFINEIKLSIKSQKYKSKWKPLSPRYLAYKKARGLSPIMWEATKQLKESLTITGTTTLTIGWDKRLLHKKSRYPLHKLAKRLEYGTMRIPPRPLFRYVYQYMSKNISRYWKKFTKLLGVSQYGVINLNRNAVNKLKETYRRAKIKTTNIINMFRKGGG